MRKTSPGMAQDGKVVVFGLCPRADSKVIKNSLIDRLEDNKHPLFAMLALAFGFLYAFVLPPLQAPDEFAHFYRAYSVSEGYLA